MGRGDGLIYEWSVSCVIGSVRKEACDTSPLCLSHLFFMHIFSSTFITYALTGGLLGVGTKLDPSLTRADALVGHVLGLRGQLPDVYYRVDISFYLLRRLLGVRASEGGRQPRVSALERVSVYRSVCHVSVSLGCPHLSAIVALVLLSSSPPSQCQHCLVNHFPPSCPSSNRVRCSW